MPLAQLMDLDSDMKSLGNHNKDSVHPFAHTTICRVYTHHVQESHKPDPPYLANICVVPLDIEYLFQHVYALILTQAERHLRGILKRDEYS